MNPTVYSQMSKSPEGLFAAMKREISYKCDCNPFAAKMLDALNSLDIRTEQQAITAANVFMSNLQTLIVNGKIKMHKKGGGKMYRSGIRHRLFQIGYC